MVSVEGEVEEEELNCKDEQVASNGVSLSASSLRSIQRERWPLMSTCLGLIILSRPGLSQFVTLPWTILFRVVRRVMDVRLLKYFLFLPGLGMRTLSLDSH